MNTAHTHTAIDRLFDTRINEIEKVYLGRDSGCRCGCHGTYTYFSPDPQNAGQKANNSRVLTILSRAKKLVYNCEAEITDSEPSYINVSYGNDRAITIYLKYDGFNTFIAK